MGRVVAAVAVVAVSAGVIAIAVTVAAAAARILAEHVRYLLWVRQRGYLGEVRAMVASVQSDEDAAWVLGKIDWYIQRVQRSHRV